jgi:hypothetical protein
MKLIPVLMERKWCSARTAGTLMSAIGILVVLWAFGGAQPAAASTPLPRPRPAQAPQAPSATADPSRATAVQNSEQANHGGTEEGVPTASPPSQCRLELTEAIAIAPSIQPIKGPGNCGGEDLVQLEAVVLSPTRRVNIKPPAILRCKMASAVADWVRSDLAPIATELGGALSELDNFDSFECRGRNRVAGAKLSEHGLANALDVRGFKLDNGQTISLTDRDLYRELRDKVRGTVCARFSTVLGPGSDWYHEDHVHLDLAQRRNDYKICQWNIFDPLPTVAPLLPAPRPEEAPQAEDGKKG